MTEKYLRPREVAAILGVSRQAIYKWIREGRITAVKFGRAVRVPSSTLAELILQGKEKNNNLDTRH